MAAYVAAFRPPAWLGIDDASLPTWLQTLTGAVLGVLGLGTLAVTILYTFTDERRLNELRESVGLELQDRLLGCLRSFLLILLGICLVFLVDRTEYPRWFNAILGSLLAWMVVASARLFWLFQIVLRALARPAAAERAHWIAPTLKPDDYGRDKVHRTRRTG